MFNCQFLGHGQWLSINPWRIGITKPVPLPKYISGHNPHNEQSRFKVRSRKGTGSDTFTVEWESVPGRKYNIYRSPSLDSEFELIATDIRCPRNRFVYPAGREGFFRVEVLLDE